MWQVIYLIDSHRVTDGFVPDELTATLAVEAWEGAGEGYATIVYDDAGVRQRLHER